MHAYSDKQNYNYDKVPMQYAQTVKDKIDIKDNASAVSTISYQTNVDARLSILQQSYSTYAMLSLLL